MDILAILKKEFAGAKESWTRFSRSFEQGEITYIGSRRVVYIPEGRKHFPVDDDKKRVKGWTTARTLNSMVRDGLIGADDDIFVLFERSPTIEGVVSTLNDVSKVHLIDIESIPRGQMF